MERISAAVKNARRLYVSYYHIVDVCAYFIPTHTLDLLKTVSTASKAIISDFSTMGNTISSIINQQQNDAKAQAEDALNSLEALANSKLDLWYNVVS